METNSRTPKTTNAETKRDARKANKAPAKPATKKDRLRALMSRKQGASLDTLQKELGWQPHTVRAAISGLRKSGCEVDCVSGKGGSVYRVVSMQAAQ